MSEIHIDQPRCAYQKDRTEGQIPCTAAHCAITLFIEKGQEKPLNLTTFMDCGTRLTPAGEFEWQEVTLPISPNGRVHTQTQWVRITD